MFALTLFFRVQLRLLLAVIEAIEISVRVANEGRDLVSPSEGRGGDGLPPAAFSYRVLYSANSFSARSAALTSKATVYLLRWRWQVIVPRLAGWRTWGRWVGAPTSSSAASAPSLCPHQSHSSPQLVDPFRRCARELLRSRLCRHHHAP